MVWGAAFSPDGRRLATGGTERKRRRETVGPGRRKENCSPCRARDNSSCTSPFLRTGTRWWPRRFDGIAHLWRAPSWAEIEAAEKGAGDAMNPHRSENEAGSINERHVLASRRGHRTQQGRRAAATSATPPISFVIFVSFCEKRSVSRRLHPHRVAGRHRDHCDPGRAAVARLGQGQGHGASRSSARATSSQLQLAWQMYADDQQRTGSCPTGSIGTVRIGRPPSSTTNSWVSGSAYTNASTAGIRQGALWRYTRKTDGIYRCPSDKSLWSYGEHARPARSTSR